MARIITVKSRDVYEFTDTVASYNSWCDDMCSVTQHTTLYCRHWFTMGIKHEMERTRRLSVTGRANNADWSVKAEDNKQREIQRHIISIQYRTDFLVKNVCVWKFRVK